MNSEVFEALDLLEKERGVPVDFMLDRVKKVILTACKNSYDNEDALINMGAAHGDFEVFLRRMVIEQVEDPGKEIPLAQTREIDPSTGLEDKVNVTLNTKEFGRIAAQTARNTIRRGIHDGERDRMIQEFQSKGQELVTALVERVDPRSGTATLKIGKAGAVPPRSEQVGDERLREGDHIKVYVVDVREAEKGPRAMISRTHPDLMKRLFEAEIPEVYDDVVKIKAVSRETDPRTRLAVISHNPDIGAIGACIGVGGARVSNIVAELGGEKVDIAKYSDDPAQFIASALSPADIPSVQVVEDGSRMCHVTVPNSQLSLAIGNKGQSARLAAKLTGWRIDIKPKNSFYGKEPVADKAEGPEGE